MTCSAHTQALATAPRWSLLAGLILASGLCTSALAQGYAGGDGRALERDLRVGVPKGLTPRASMADEVRMRNALITGNVGGLRSFHGNVGYTAPDDFRGSLGSDATYSFRRDSASAGQFTRPVRGGDGLRYQFYTSTGLAQRPMDEVGRLGATGAAAAKASPGEASSQASGSRGETLTQRLGAMRSTATFDATRDLTPAVVGYAQVGRGYQPITASSLLGLRTSDRAPLTTRYAAREEEKERPGLTRSLAEPLSSPVNQSETENQIRAIQEPVTRTLYEDLRDRMKEQEKRQKEEGGRVPDGKAPDGRPADQKSPDQKSPNQKPPDGQGPGTPDRPAQSPDSARPAGADLPAGEQSDTDARLQALRDKLLPRDKRVIGRSMLKPEKDPGSARPGDATDIFDEKTIDLIRRSGGETRAFIDAPSGAQLDAYSQHMKAGQELMGKNKFFDAEERFARALQERTGDVTAMAARIHAQMGAGLYLSAALNIRQLFVQAPEVIALRYTGDTIPPPQRLASIAADLRANITRARDAQTSPSVGDSLLLAYVGWQLGDAATVGEGLTQAQKSAEASGKPEPLVALLRKTWLEAPAGDPRFAPSK